MRFPILYTKKEWKRLVQKSLELNMWIPPEKTTTIDLIWGRVEFGRARYGGGQTAGTAPIMARLDCNGFGNGWFPVLSYRSMWAVGEAIMAHEGTVPLWLEQEARRSGNFE